MQFSFACPNSPELYPRLSLGLQYFLDFSTSVVPFMKSCIFHGQPEFSGIRFQSLGTEHGVPPM